MSKLDLAQEAEAGVAGADVVGREPHPRPAAGLDVRPQLVEVLDLLALGQLEHDPVERDVVALEDRLELADPEVVRLERPRREVDAEVRIAVGQPGAFGDGLQAGQVELDGPVGGLGGR